MQHAIGNGGHCTREQQKGQRQLFPDLQAGNRIAVAVILQPHRRIEEANRPALRSLVEDLRANGIDVAGVEDLRQRFDPAWPGIEGWIARVLPQLTRIIFGLQGIIDPEAIVFGGQIPPALADTLIARISFGESARYNRPLPAPVLIKGEASGEPAATGAALLALKKRYFL